MKSNGNRKVRRSGNPAKQHTTSFDPETSAALAVIPNTTAVCCGEWPLTETQKWSMAMLELLEVGGESLPEYLFPDSFFAPLAESFGLEVEEVVEECRFGYIAFMFGVSGNYHAHHPADRDERLFSVAKPAPKAYDLVVGAASPDTDHTAHVLVEMVNEREFALRWTKFLLELERRGVPVPPEAWRTRGYETVQVPA